MPSVPPAATAPAARVGRYPSRSISGIDTRLIVSAVATDDPQIAPNMPEAKMAAMESDPRAPRSVAFAARNRSPLSPAAAATVPMRVNSGTTERL